MHAMEVLNLRDKLITIVDNCVVEGSAGFLFQPDTGAENLGDGAFTIALRANKDTEPLKLNGGGLGYWSDVFNY